MNYVLYVVNANKANGYFSFLIYLISQQHLASLTYPLIEITLSWLSFSCWLLLLHFLCWLLLFYLIKFCSTSDSVLSPLFFFYTLLHSISFEPYQLPWLQISSCNPTQTAFFCYEPIFVMTLLKSLNKQNNTSQTYLFFSNSPATILIQATTIALLNYIAKASQLVSLYPLPSSSIYSLRRRQVFKKLQSDHVTSLHTPFPGMALSINCKLFNVALPVLNNLVITYLSPSISSLHSNHANLFSFP